LLVARGVMGRPFVAGIGDGWRQVAESRLCARGRARTLARFVPNRSARIGTGAEPPDRRAPAARCELRQLALRKTPAVRLNQEEFCLTLDRSNKVSFFAP
jgi:hypothetical protein